MKVEKAAADLEDLSVELKKIIIKLRKGQGNPYALVYDFRTKVGRVVATLGAGKP